MIEFFPINVWNIMYHLLSVDFLPSINLYQLFLLIGHHFFFLMLCFCQFQISVNVFVSSLGLRCPKVIYQLNPEYKQILLLVLPQLLKQFCYYYLLRKFRSFFVNNCFQFHLEGFRDHFQDQIIIALVYFKLKHQKFQFFFLLWCF